jgi:hypothetical protein
VLTVLGCLVFYFLLVLVLFSEVCDEFLHIIYSFLFYKVRFFLFFSIGFYGVFGIWIVRLHFFILKVPVSYGFVGTFLFFLFQLSLIFS